MKFRTSISLMAGIGAFLLATSCCWLPFLAATLLGSVVGATAFSAQVEPFSGALMAIGAGGVAFAGWRFLKKKRAQQNANLIVLESQITCPKCGFHKMETMPTDACQFFYACENCKEVLKPLPGDCCVFCSYGTVKCPPIQTGTNCC